MNFAGRTVLRNQSHGFTLVEMAVVVGVMALLISGLMVPATVWLEQRGYSETEALLASTTEAIVGFAALQGRLPCPDRNGDGLEDFRLPTEAAGNNCAPQDAEHAWGFLPAATLGIRGVDGWGNRLHYSVAPRLTVVDRFSAIGATTLSVSCSSQTVASGGVGFLPGCNDPMTGVPINLSTNAAFLLLSFGRNRLGAISEDGLTAYPSPVSPDEITNVVPMEGSVLARANFVSRIRTNISSPMGEFDDVLAWMSSNQLAARLQQAGQWP